MNRTTALHAVSAAAALALLGASSWPRFSDEPKLMSIPPDSLEVGKCYLLETGHVRRVVRLMPDGRVQFESRVGHQRNAGGWRPGMQDIRAFAFLIEREVPCDWTPETDEGNP